MLAPAMAIAADFWGRNKGLIAALVAVLPFTVAVANLLPGGRPGEVPAIRLMFVFYMMVCFFIAEMVLITYHMSDTRSNELGFPPRMFVLPLRTSVMVGLPMLFGALALAVSWVVIAGAVVPACGLERPDPWPAPAWILALLWLQALGWWPFGSQAAKLLVGLAVLVGLAGIPYAAEMLGGQGRLVLWCISPFYAAGAYAVAVIGVARDRRGDGRTLGALRLWLERKCSRAREADRTFDSPRQSLMWFEWRSKGYYATWLLGGVAAIGLECLPLVIDDQRAALGLLAILFLSPVFASGFIGPALASEGLSSRDLQFSPFLATRPVTSTEIARVKFRTATRIVLTAWIMVFALAFTGLAYLRGGPYLAKLWEELIRHCGNSSARAVGTVAFVLIVLHTMTWRGVTGTMVASLTGRRWAPACLMLPQPVLVAIAVLVIRLSPEFDLLREAARLLPWALTVALMVKGGVTFLAFRKLRQRRSYSDLRVGITLATWSLEVCGLLALGWLALPLPAYWKSSLALGIAVLAPLGRRMLAPLAIDWNRHR